MGLANWLTILRILLIPVFVTLLVYRRARGALVVFCLASFTDMLDGYIARSHGSQSRLGAFLDPLADKLLLTSAFVTLTYLKVIPFWITAVVVSRDLILSVGVLVIHVAGGTVHPAPTWIGKTSTVCPDGRRPLGDAVLLLPRPGCPAGLRVGGRGLHHRVGASVPDPGPQAAESPR